MKKLASWFIILSVIFSLCICGEVATNEKTEDEHTPASTESDKITFETKPVRDGLDEEIYPNVYKMYGDMRVHFIDVGQGDSIFIELGNGMTMLIDAGESGSGRQVANYIKDLQYGDIDFVVATHPHDDHIGGMAYVLNELKVGKMYMPEKEHTTKAFENMLNAIEANNIDLYPAKAGTNILTSGYITIDLLAPVEDSYSNLNNYSAVVKITYGETVFLFMGDAESKVEKSIINSGVKADVLKVGHHGSDTSSCQSFIEAVAPRVAVISCGADNQYGHPDDSTLLKLQNAGAYVFRTDEAGTIQITADMHGELKINKRASKLKENAPPEEMIVQKTNEDR